MVGRHALLQEQSDLARQVGHATTSSFLRYKLFALDKEAEFVRERADAEDRWACWQDEVHTRRSAIVHMPKSAKVNTVAVPGKKPQPKPVYHHDLDDTVAVSASESHVRSTKQQYLAPSRSPSAVRGTSQPAAVIDVESQPLKPPGHEEPDFQRAAFAGDVPAVVADTSAQRMEPCNLCGRMFAADRIAVHRDACRKSAAAAKKRKAYDARQARVQGVLKENGVEDSQIAGKLLQTSSDSETERKLELLKKKKAGWRQQSAQLQRVLRQARGPGGAQGAIEDEEEDLRVPCPGCGRRFAPDTAERHIPKCTQKAK